MSIRTYDDEKEEITPKRRGTVTEQLQAALDANKALKAQLAAATTATPATPVKPATPAKDAPTPKATREALLAVYESLPDAKAKARFRRDVLGYKSK